eukprot:209852-Hanusia_phi.AAC.1
MISGTVIYCVTDFGGGPRGRRRRRATVRSDGPTVTASLGVTDRTRSHGQAAPRLSPAAARPPGRRATLG